jgi:hypothetical protein
MILSRFTAGVKVVDIDSLEVLIPKDLISFAVSLRKSFFLPLST